MTGEQQPPGRPLLRPWLRVVVYVGLWLVAGLAASVVVVLVALVAGLTTAGRLLELDPSRDWSFFALSNLAMLGSTLLVTRAAVRWLDRRSLASLGLGWKPGETANLLFGIALGVALISVVFLVELATGWVRIHDLLSAAPAAFWPAFAGILVAFVATAIAEEVVSRGYVLQNLAEQWGPWPAVAASSALFAVLHSLNPGVGPLAVVLLVGAGLLFAAAFYAGRSLWLPIGLHFGWNAAEGLVYGFPVSGLATPRLIVTEQLGPTLVTGGRFGPEGGLIVVLPLALGLAALWGWRWRCSRAIR